jgi:peptidoglycan hydrolase-like protein with peptidoglycan-binding domain
LSLDRQGAFCSTGILASVPESLLKKAVWIEVLTYLCAGAFLFAATTTPPATSKKKASSKKTAAKRTTRKPAAASWRSTQKAPTPERYKEIQQALASKGYLQSGAPSGVWDNSSVEALKKFQSDQSLEPSGKLDSLSLIGLGLGPKRDQQPAPQP